MSNPTELHDGTGAVDASDRMAEQLRLQQQRIRRGECPGCGVEVFKFVGLLRKKKVPLTIPGHVENGQCLSCNNPNKNENNEDGEEGGDPADYENQLLQQQQDAEQQQDGTETLGSIPRYLSVNQRTGEDDNDDETDAMSAVSGLTSAMGPSVIAMQNATAATNGNRGNAMATAQEPPLTRPGAYAASPTGLSLQQEQQAAVQQQHGQQEEMRRHQLMLQKIEEAEGESASASFSQQQQSSQASQVEEMERQQLLLLKKIQEEEEQANNNVKSAYKTGDAAGGSTAGASQPGAFAAPPTPPSSSQQDQPPGDLTREEWLMIQKVEEAERARQSPAKSQPGAYATPPRPRGDESAATAALSPEEVLLMQKVEEAENASQSHASVTGSVTAAAAAAAAGAAATAAAAGGQQRPGAYDDISFLEQNRQDELRQERQDELAEVRQRQQEAHQEQIMMLKVQEAERVGASVGSAATGREHLPGAFAQPGLVAAGARTSSVPMTFDEESREVDEQVVFQADTAPLPPGRSSELQQQQEAAEPNGPAKNQDEWYQKRSVQIGIVAALLALIVVLIVVIVVVAGGGDSDSNSGNGSSGKQQQEGPAPAPTPAPQAAFTRAPTPQPTKQPTNEKSIHDFDQLTMFFVQWGHVDPECAKFPDPAAFELTCSSGLKIQKLDQSRSFVTCREESDEKLVCSRVRVEGTSLHHFSNTFLVGCAAPRGAQTQLNAKTLRKEGMSCGVWVTGTNPQIYLAQGTASLSVGKVCFPPHSRTDTIDDDLVTLQIAEASDCLGDGQSIPVEMGGGINRTIQACGRFGSCTSSSSTIDCNLEVPSAQQWTNFGSSPDCSALLSKSNGQFLWNRDAAWNVANRQPEDPVHYEMYVHEQLTS